MIGSPSTRTRHSLSLRFAACGVAAALLAGVPSAAATGVTTPCPVDLPGEILAVENLLQQEDAAGAAARAAALTERCPGHPVAVRLHARALVATDDPAAARDLLQQYLDANPLDCQTWSWLAWVALEKADPLGAWVALSAPACPATPQETARWAVVEALAAHHGNDPDGVREALDKVEPGVLMWPEDADLLAFLEYTVDPHWQWPWQATVELGAGATSNALAGSPTDTAGEGESSALGRINARTVLFGPQTGRVIPFGEVAVRSHGLADDSARELSYLELSGRAGAVLRLGATRASVALRRDALHLNRDPDSRYFAVWRGELDLELPGGTVVFAGGGKREFDDPWRTRREYELGVARGLRLGGQPFTIALAGRRFNADEPVYDQRGGTLTTVTHLQLAPRWMARVSALVSRDIYPRSDTWQGLIAFGSDAGRRDTVGRVSLGAWRQMGGGLQAGVTYEHARRWSSIDEGFQGSFAYREHRVMVGLRFDTVADPWRRTAAPADHVTLAHGLTPPAPGLGDERIRDLIRLDEEMRPDCPVCP